MTKYRSVLVQEHIIWTHRLLGDCLHVAVPVACKVVRWVCMLL